MKAATTVLAVLGLAILAGCASLGTGPQQQAVTTAQWTYYPDYQTLGIQMKRDIPQSYSGPAEIVFTSAQDIDAAVTLTDVRTGEENEKGVALFLDGTVWTADIDFPGTGQYAVTIYGRLHSNQTASYPALAQTHLTALGDPSASLRYFPGFKAHGLSMSALPAREAQETALVSVSSDEPLTFSASLMDSSGKWVPHDAMSVKDTATNHRITISFPESGAYTLIVSARPVSGTDEDWEGVLMASFNATVTPTAIPGAPANWTATSLARPYELIVTSSTGRAAGDTAGFVFTSPQDLRVGYDLRNLTTGKTSRDMGNPVVVENNAPTHAISVFFPESGEYQLDLYVGGKGDSSLVKAASVLFTATVKNPPAPVPENWSIEAGYFRKYGLTVTSCTARNAGDVADIVLTSPQDLSVSYNLRNLTTGQIGRDMGDPVVVEDKAPTHAISVFFPESGEYQLDLYVGGKGESREAKAASVLFTATVAPGSVPENWSIAAASRKYRPAIASSPGRQVGDTLNVVLTIAKPPEKWEGSVSLYSEDADSFVSSAGLDVVGNELHVSAVFPASGTYSLTARLLEENGHSWVTIAKGTFTAKVDESLSPYRLWLMGGSWSRLPAASVQTVKEDWQPFGIYSRDSEHGTATLTRDLQMQNSLATVTIPKGRQVNYSTNYDDKTYLVAVATTLPKVLTVAVYGTKVTFKAGGAFAIGEHELAGVTAADAKIVIDGNTLLAPKGSRVCLYDKMLEEVDLGARSSLTVAGKVYECSGPVIVDDWGVSDRPIAMRIATTRDYAFKLGTTSFAAPAGSLVTFLRQSLRRVVFLKDTKATLNGVVDTIPAGWGIQFDDSGSGSKIQAE